MKRFTLVVHCVALVACAAVIGGCGDNGSAFMKSLQPKDGAVLFCVDTSGCGPAAAQTALAVASLYCSPRVLGAGRALTALTFDRDNRIIFDDYGKAKPELKAALKALAQGHTEPEQGTNVAAALGQAAAWLATETAAGHEATVVLISDLTSDPIDGQPSADPCSFQWKLTAPQLVHLRVYTLADATRGPAVQQAWAASLAGADVRVFRPKHKPGPEDL